MNAELASCPHRPPCPGCPRFGSSGISTSALSSLRALASQHGLPEPRVFDNTAPGYRHRARLAVRGRARSPKIGIFQEGTHQIVDIPNCLVHHPAVNQMAREIKAEVKSLGVAPYSDLAHAGLLRYLQIVIERSTGLAQVVLVTNSDQYDSASTALCEAVQRRLGSSLQGLFWNGNPDRHNAILGPHWHTVWGESAVRENLGGAQVFFPPGAFGQSNLGLFEQVISQVHDWARGANRITELYAGTGALGLGLAQLGSQITFNELESASLAGLQMGLSVLPESVRGRVRVAAGSAEQVALTACAGADLVIADPPRKGLDNRVLVALNQHKPRTFVYLSCGLDSFLRDAAVLTESYRLTALEAYTMFPFTEHVETLARFERA